MCRFSAMLKSPNAGAVLYVDKSPAAKEMRHLLDAAGANYLLASAKKEAMPGPVLVIGGSFLGLTAVREVVNGGQKKSRKGR